MSYYLNLNNQVYGGDRQQRDDGSFDPIAPERPTDQHQWDGSQWALPESERNYLGFYQGLLNPDEGLPLFWYVRSIASTNLLVNTAYTDLMGSLQFQQLPGFQSSIWILVASMQGAGYALSTEQLASMRSLLDHYGFSDVSLN